MKWMPLFLWLLSCGVAAAEQAQQVRVSLQFIELPHPLLTELLGGNETGGNALHAKAVSLTKEGKAKILDSCVVTGRCGQKLTLESIREEIYPTEYGPPSLPCSIGSTPGIVLPEPPSNPLYRFIGAFETRNTGVTFEVDASIEDDGKSIGLHLVPEWVTPVRLETWAEHRDQWGDASFRMPVYETLRVNSQVSVIPGMFELVSVITPKPVAPVPGASRKVLVFVRAEIIAVPGG